MTGHADHTSEATVEVASEQTSGRTPGDTPVLPPAAYVDGARFEAERWAVFFTQWTAVGDADQVAEPGSYVAIWVAGFPLVVVNDGGVLRAFHNVCRHRAGPLADEGVGTCRSLVCRYHGWAYGLDGTLLSARDFGAEVASEQFSLVPASVDRWRGLLFVSPAPPDHAGLPNLSTWLGAVADHSEPFAMEQFQVTHRSHHDIECNWKVYAENYQEGYHIPLVHPGLNRQVDAKQYQVDVVGEATVHSAPTRDGAVTNGAWLWRYPGFALNLYPSGMCLESYWPTGPTTTRVSYTFFFTPETPVDEAQGAVDSSTLVLDEDRIICEAIQRNLASGLTRPGVLSPKYEAGVALVQRLVTEALSTTANPLSD